MNPECDAPGCVKKSRAKSGGYCDLHLGRLRRSGTLELQKIKFICTNCGTEFFGRQRRKNAKPHCSDKCSRQYKDRQKIKRVSYDRAQKRPDCKVCGTKIGKGRYSYCSDKCYYEYRNVTGLANSAQIKYKYGITEKHRTNSLIQQEHKCLICKRHESELSKRLVIDHDHDTLKIRGMLCGQCNSGIGLLQDNPDILRNAANYLEGFGK